MGRKIDLVLLIVSAASLASCGRDPAKEAPVTLKPGVYEVKLTGGGLAQFAQDGPGVTHDKICVSESGAEYFPKKLAQNYLTMGPSCESGNFDRTGNAISGKFSCGVDPERASGEIKMTYAGVVSEERVDLDGEVKFDITVNDPEAQKEMEGSPLTKGVAIKLTAQRKGDCPTS